MAEEHYLVVHDRVNNFGELFNRACAWNTDLFRDRVAVDRLKLHDNWWKILWWLRMKQRLLMPSLLFMRRRRKLRRHIQTIANWSDKINLVHFNFDQAQFNIALQCFIVIDTVRRYFLLLLVGSLCLLLLAVAWSCNINRSFRRFGPFFFKSITLRISVPKKTARNANFLGFSQGNRFQQC